MGARAAVPGRFNRPRPSAQAQRSSRPTLSPPSSGFHAEGLRCRVDTRRIAPQVRRPCGATTGRPVGRSRTALPAFPSAASGDATQGRWRFALRACVTTCRPSPSCRPWSCATRLDGLKGNFLDDVDGAYLPACVDSACRRCPVHCKQKSVRRRQVSRPPGRAPAPSKSVTHHATTVEPQKSPS